MNPFKKAFCRVYQLAFYAAMPFLPYREPESFRKVDDLVPLMQKLRVTSLLLVTDKGLRGAGLTTPLEALLKQNGISCTVYDDTRPNPTTANVEDAVNLYRKHSCQAMIAFGGGSSMDCAKAVGARIAYPNRSLRQLGGTLKIFRKLPPIAAVPTTAGTGSEVTVTAVITDADTHHKYTMNSFPLIPRYAVLDPEVTRTLPPSLTATTGMDALTHAVEAYIGRSTTKETRSLALTAVGLVFRNIEKAYQNGDDLQARENMLRASYLAGRAFTKSYVGYIHAVAHSLGGQYNIPHGLANAVLLPIGLEIYGKTVYNKLHELGIAAGVTTPDVSHEQGAKDFIRAIRGLNRRMNIPETLSGILEEDIPTMARHADREANPLYPVPKLMDARELEIFYYTAADWSKHDDDTEY
ncbi:MAG: iron-containing alcohol dehydrogenase [Ruminococcaceae bacterium]|nr:iron-containing alcohol dehydrogenase [Oscillospiraceae bacterium]